jgi:glutamate carboxypeptidase
MREILRYLRGRENQIVRLLGKFVRCESPSCDKRAVDACGLMVAAEWRRRGASVRILRQAKCGNHVRAELWLGQGRPAGQIMVLGHLDTVYPLGTIAKMPFRVSGGKAWGPGTFDMKGGLAQTLFAVEALRAAKIRSPKRLVFFWNSDEEIGSHSSRRAIEAEARRSDAVLVLEPAFGADGRLKTARKGVGTAEILVTGRSAHAGIDPKSGVNAVHEVALQIVRLAKLNNPRRGIVVQATVIAGGTVSNVVPDHARAEVDIRYSRLVDAAPLDRKLHGIRPILPGARVEIRGGVNRPPLERTAAVRNLFAQAQSLMREMGLSLGEASTGGGSDGNLTAALGVPTLDGLGAVGDGAHSPREHVVVRAMLVRAALLAGLLATL